MIACVVLNYNDGHETKNFVDRIQGYVAIDHIIVVDNCSTDNSLKLLKELESSKVHVIECEKNGGYGAGNNRGVSIAYEVYNCKYVLIANPDVYFEEEIVWELFHKITANPSCAAISGRQLDARGKSIKNSAWKIPCNMQFILQDGIILRHFVDILYHHDRDQACIEVDCLAGAFLMIDADKFKKIGGYDEEIFLYYEETVIGKKVQNNGFQTLYMNNICYKHLHGITINKSIKSQLGRIKIMLKSKKYVLKVYLHASLLEQIFNNIFSAIILTETVLKGLVRQVINENRK